MNGHYDNHRGPWSVIVLTLCAVCALTLVLDLVIHRHEKLAFAGSFGFYAWFSFIACVVLILAARGLQHLLMRGENYYGDRDD